MKMDDNPYQAPISPSAVANRGSLAGDVLIAGIADAVMVLLALAYQWLITHEWGGMASVHVALWLAILVMICTALAGTRIHRPTVGIAGIAVLWAIRIVSDALTSRASLTSILLDLLTGIGVVLFGVQLAAFLVPWWIAEQARTYNKKLPFERYEV